MWTVPRSWEQSPPNPYYLFIIYLIVLFIIIIIIVVVVIIILIKFASATPLCTHLFYYYIAISEY